MNLSLTPDEILDKICNNFALLEQKDHRQDILYHSYFSNNFKLASDKREQVLKFLSILENKA